MDRVMTTGILAGNSIHVSSTSAIKRTKYSWGSRNTTSRAWGYLFHSAQHWDFF